MGANCLTNSAILKSAEWTRKQCWANIHPADRGQLADPWSGGGMPRGTPLFGNLTFAEPDDVIELAGRDKISLAGLDLVELLVPTISLAGPPSDDG